MPEPIVFDERYSLEDFHISSEFDSDGQQQIVLYHKNDDEARSHAIYLDKRASAVAVHELLGRLINAIDWAE